MIQKLVITLADHAGAAVQHQLALLEGSLGGRVFKGLVQRAKGRVGGTGGKDNQGAGLVQLLAQGVIAIGSEGGTGDNGQQGGEGQ
ncbi:hypothetical protein D3C85_1637970 [compost metagenome]